MTAFNPWTKSMQKCEVEERTRFERADTGKKDEASNWREVCEAVDARDKRRCRACGRAANPNAVGVLQRAHRHHIVYRSAGGLDTLENLVTLCASCHNEEHRHRLRIEGTGEAITVFALNKVSGWYISRQETAPHVLVARD